jgi:hypothetical protein
VRCEGQTITGLWEEWKDIEIRGACEIVRDDHHGREMILLARPMIAAAQPPSDGRASASVDRLSFPSTGISDSLWHEANEAR